ncbi:MAG: hypothetical protein HY268_19150 [Deltaproteobacteria bacterium]|nr:hypothetical protein [Deltaproteobacteria bacterium]
MKRALVSLVFSLHLISLAVAGVKTDLQENGLIGPVQTVRVEDAQFSSQSGQWVEGRRRPMTTITYDIRGNKIEEIAPDSKTLYTYNAQENLSAIVSYDPNRSLCQFGYPCDAEGRKLETRLSYDAQGRKLETRLLYFDGTPDQKIVYTYDDKGHLIEEVTSDRGGLIGKMVYTYDDQGHLLKEDVHGPGDGFKYRSVHTYDEQGKRIATTNYYTHGPALGIEKVVTTYDSQGNILELTTYYTEKIIDEDKEDRSIPPPAKRLYNYEFDAHGNWVKQIETRCLSETSQLVCEPFTVTYRTITYYTEAETPSH